MRSNYLKFHVLWLSIVNEFVGRKLPRDLSHVYELLKPGVSLVSNQDAQEESVRGIYDKAAVATDNGVCSEIGKDILIQGGNAVDAIIASTICVGVINAHSCGLGGGHFLTVYNKTTKSCVVFDARERAPMKSSEELYRKKHTSIDGWLAIAVPGELHGFWTAYKQLGGKVPWKNLWEPTIKLCRDGYRVHGALAKALIQAKTLIENNNAFDIFKNVTTGEYVKRDDFMKRPKLADIMEKIANADDPVQLFYNSSLTSTLVSEIMGNGGVITMDDFRTYLTRFGPVDRPVITTKIKKSLSLCGPPPPSSAGLIGSILNIIDGYNFAEEDLYDVSTASLAFHKIIEAMKFAYGNRYNFGDMDFLPSAAYLAETINYNSFGVFTRNRIKMQSFKDPTYYGTSTIKWDTGTAHLSVVDSSGNAASLTSTINTYFGAKVMSESTGIIYNNEMDDFSFSHSANFFNISPSPANKLVPGKRPQSSMSPVIIFDDQTGDVKMVVGGAGGSKIISAVAQVIIRVIYFLQDIKKAIDAPRVHNQLESSFETFYENFFSQDVVRMLREIYGQKMNQSIESFPSVVIGIHRMANGSLEANSDFRKAGGYPAGY